MQYETNLFLRGGIWYAPTKLIVNGCSGVMGSPLSRSRDLNSLKRILQREITREPLNIGFQAWDEFFKRRGLPAAFGVNTLDELGRDLKNVRIVPKDARKLVVSIHKFNAKGNLVNVGDPMEFEYDELPTLAVYLDHQRDSTFKAQPQIRIVGGLPWVAFQKSSIDRVAKLFGSKGRRGIEVRKGLQEVGKRANRILIVKLPEWTVAIGRPLYFEADGELLVQRIKEYSSASASFGELQSYGCQPASDHIQWFLAEGGKLRAAFLFTDGILRVKRGATAKIAKLASTAAGLAELKHGYALPAVEKVLRHFSEFSATSPAKLLQCSASLSRGAKWVSLLQS